MNKMFVVPALLMALMYSPPSHAASEPARWQIAQDRAVGCKTPDLTHQLESFIDTGNREAFESAVSIWTSMGVCRTFKKGQEVYVDPPIFSDALLCARLRGDNDCLFMLKGSVEQIRWNPVMPILVQPWPPNDPNEEDTSVAFTSAWAKSLRGFHTLAEIQKAAGSKGKITERGKHYASYHWISKTRNDVSFLLARQWSDGSVGVGMMTTDVGEIVLNTFGAFFCEKCNPPIDVQGAEPSWSRVDE